MTHAEERVTTDVQWTCDVAEFRDMQRKDLPHVLALNQAAVPAVGTLDTAGLERLYALSKVRWVLAKGDVLAAIMFAMEPGTDYQSPNYRWLAERYERFVYVDRIAIAPEFQRQGLGARIYQKLAAYSRAQNAKVMLAEVNVQPPNPQSIAFHEASGWKAVDDLAHAHDKVVRFFEYRL